VDGKPKEEALGWASQGWNAVKASIVLSDLKRAHVTGEGPRTLFEKRRLAKEQEEAQKKRQDQQALEQITFGQIFRESYFPQARSDKTERSYRREESLFTLWIAPIIGDLPMREIAPTHLQRIKKNMATAGRADRSIRYALEVVRQVFNFAKFNNLFDGDSPTANVKWPRKDNKRLRFLTREEADRLLEALAMRSQKLHEMALISLHCGARADEIFSLSWGDVDLERGTLTLRDTKNTKTRTAYMTQMVREVLARKKRGENGDLVFPDSRGGKIQQISKTFDKVADELALNEGITDPRQRVVFHTLRHTYASWMVEAGEDLYTVKKLMGHSTLAMTERYSHVRSTTLQRAVKAFEEHLNRSPSKVVPLQQE